MVNYGRRRSNKRTRGVKHSALTKRPTAENQKSQILGLASQVSALEKATVQNRQWVSMVKNVNLTHYMRTWTGGNLPYQSFALSDIENYAPLFSPSDEMGMGIEQRQKVRVRGVTITSHFASHDMPEPCVFTMLIVSAKKARGPLTELEPNSAHDHFDFTEGKDWITNQASPTVKIDDIFTMNKELWQIHGAKKFIIGAQPSVTASVSPSGGMGDSNKAFKMRCKFPGTYINSRTSTLSWKILDIRQLPYYQRLFVIIFASNHHTSSGPGAVAPLSHHMVELLISST